MTSVKGQAQIRAPKEAGPPHTVWPGPGSLRLNANGELEVAVADVNHTSA
jgi:hypothetical protein